MRTQVTMLQVIIVMSILAGITCAAAQPMPTINEILDKYTQALDSTQSFISETESSHVGSCNIPEWGMRHGNVKSQTIAVNRTDNKGRSYSQSYKWGYIDAYNTDAPREQALYRLDVFGDTFAYQHNRHLGTGHKGSFTYTAEGKPDWGDRKHWGYFERNEGNNLFLGYVQNRARLDSTLKNANHISLSQKTQLINGSVCYVVMADTPRGTYKIWFDSEHGYHPSKLQAMIDAGDDINDPGNPHIITPEEGIQRRYTLDNVRFEKIDDIWVPMEADRTHHIILGVPENFSSGKTHFKRNKITLNPDHDALGSFANPVENPRLDPELVNGAVVHLWAGKCTWQDGRIVDDQGKLVFDPHSVQ